MLHTDKETSDDVQTLVITHPFHPEKGKSFEYLGQIDFEKGSYVKCLDEQGNIRKFPRSITNLHTSNANDYSICCVASVEDLLLLKELVDAILNSCLV
ncbi:hypothetical protein FACS1894191_4950 [Clostridia bacterium]|nr:hypothetical protein FACS1894191_4950 [Clostridia bacterium]